MASKLTFKMIPTDICWMQIFNGPTSFYYSNMIKEARPKGQLISD